MLYRFIAVLDLRSERITTRRKGNFIHRGRIQMPFPHGGVGFSFMKVYLACPASYGEHLKTKSILVNVCESNFHDSM